VRPGRAGTRRLASLGALGACLLLTGCYAGTAQAISPHEVAADPGWLLVPGVPLVRQSGRSDCGAAALAMILGYWSQPTTVQEINARDPAAAARGWKAGQLRDLAREKGLQAFVVSGRLSDLTTEIGQRRPVLVGLAQRYGKDQSRAHYEVVIGIHPTRRLILTLDPAAGWRQDTLEGFAREWIPTQEVTLVFLPPAAAADAGAGAGAPRRARATQRSPGAS
jgi:ABC-type bacteriocin/lantibiotic exporter with double-glycine peptidase domain